MSVAAAAARPDVPPRRRLRLSTLVKVARNPLEALPPQLHHESFVRFTAAGVERIYLLDPELIREALVTHADALEKSEDVRRTLGPALGQGLLTAEGREWRWQRRATAPAFQASRLAGMTPAMLDAARRLRDRWLARPEDSVLRMGHEMMGLTFDIIVETMMGGGDPAHMQVAKVEQAITDYLEPVGWVLAYSLARAPNWLPYPGRRKAKAAAAYLRETLAQAVARRRETPGAHEDLVALLLAAADPETGRTMTDVEIVDNLITFITAGHETTALGLAWTLHLLTQHPAIDARVRAEIDAVTEGREVTPEHVAKLDYTRQVFAEAMRLYPPAPLISRKVLRPLTIGPHAIAEGSVVIVPIHALHRHASLWDDPERFDPDRFAPAQAKARPRHAYMPFGAGPRICIGASFATLEATAILAVLLQRTKLTDAADRPSVPTMRITLRPAPDLRMRVSGRRHTFVTQP